MGPPHLDPSTNIYIYFCEKNTRIDPEEKDTSYLLILRVLGPWVLGSDGTKFPRIQLTSNLDSPYSF